MRASGRRHLNSQNERLALTFTRFRVARIVSPHPSPHRHKIILIKQGMDEARANDAPGIGSFFHRFKLHQLCPELETDGEFLRPGRTP